MRPALAAVATALSLLAAPGFAAEEVMQLETPTGAVHGTLLRPDDAPRPLVALIVAGSGPTDRDGNNPVAGHNDSLKLLAQALADAGIASLRYDKRGIAASAAAGADESTLRFDDYVDDAAAWARRLAQDGRFAAVAIVGHSEGATIAALAAARA
ncbi:alpha/beta hydrolase, partial [Rubrivivax gelatinosus]